MSKLTGEELKTLVKHGIDPTEVVAVRRENEYVAIAPESPRRDNGYSSGLAAGAGITGVIAAVFIFAVLRRVRRAA